jgi:hypothetical protein
MDEIHHFGYKKRVPIKFIEIKNIIKIINLNFENNWRWVWTKPLAPGR